MRTPTKKDPEFREPPYVAHTWFFWEQKTHSPSPRPKKERVEAELGLCENGPEPTAVMSPQESCFSYCVYFTSIFEPIKRGEDRNG